MRVGFATADWSQSFWHEGQPTLGGSGHYRTGIPSALLAAAGHDVVVGTLVGQAKGAGLLGVQPWGENAEPRVDLDVVVMQRWMYADLPEAVVKARRAGQYIVNDVDDWWEGLDPRNQAFRATHPKVNPEVNRDHYRKTLARSSMLACSTPFLHKQMRKVCPEAALLRNVIDLERWPRGREHAGAPVLGWVGALPWRSGDVETLKGILGPFLEAHDLRFRHEGHVDGWGSVAEAAGVGESRVDVAPMRPIHEYPGMFDGIDLMVIPLSDRPFNHAKSAVKAMESVASGIPYVASATPEYVWFETQGIGRTAKRPHHWTRHLTELLDPEVRAAEAKANLERLTALNAELSGRWLRTFAAIPTGAVPPSPPRVTTTLLTSPPAG